MHGFVAAGRLPDDDADLPGRHGQQHVVLDSSGASLARDEDGQGFDAVAHLGEEEVDAVLARRRSGGQALEEGDGVQQAAAAVGFRALFVPRLEGPWV